MEVKFFDPDKMNLIGYFLRDILRANLFYKPVQKKAEKLKGAILFNASGMEATLIFHDKSVEIYQGATENINANITGDLNALLDVALGANYLKFIITAKIKIGGNVFLLLKLMKILRVQE